LRYLCDTTFLIDLVAGDEGAARKAKEVDEHGVYVAISAVTAHEYLRGIYYLYSGTDKFEEKLREAMADISRFIVIPFDLEVAEVAAQIDAELIKRGKPLSYPDVVIAATALSKDLTLVTRNVRHFSRVSRLAVESY